MKEEKKKKLRTNLIKFCLFYFTRITVVVVIDNIEAWSGVIFYPYYF